MPFASESQRRFMYAKQPELAREFEAATPKGQKLPEKKHPEKTVKRAYETGVKAALERYGFKQAGEEIRLKIPNREFHGFDGAFKTESQRNQKRADDGMPDPLEPQADPENPVERLTEMLQQLSPPAGSADAEATKNHLDRTTMWSTPSSLSAGDTANRASDMGQNTAVGMV